MIVSPSDPGDASELYTKLTDPRAGPDTKPARGGCTCDARPDPSYDTSVAELKAAPPGNAVGDLAGDLNRAFAKPIDVDPAARPMTFTGVLVLDDEDAVVGRLAAFLPIKADRTATRIVLSSSR